VALFQNAFTGIPYLGVAIRIAVVQDVTVLVKLRSKPLLGLVMIAPKLLSGATA
jgi:hypothetical protein